MKKILLITMFALSLQASQCWNLETQNWINFNWIKDAKYLINAIDENYRQLHAYHLHDELVACFYTDSEYR